MQPKFVVLMLTKEAGGQLHSVSSMGSPVCVHHTNIFIFINFHVPCLDINVLFF